MSKSEELFQGISFVGFLWTLICPISRIFQMGQIRVHKNCLFTKSLFEHLFAPFENQMRQISVQLNNSVLNSSSGQLFAPIEI